VRLDPLKSSLRVRTFAEGLFSRLAHDLELACERLDGSVEGDAARIVFAIEDMRVLGTVSSGKLNPAGLSESDRRDCLAKMRADVFHAERGRVEVVATRDRAARITLPGGRTVPHTIGELEVEGAHVRGRTELSLRTLGSDPVKGPMNAFRVKDAIAVTFDLSFA